VAEGRRAFLARVAMAAGVAAPVVALLEGRALALPAGERPDLAILSAALMLEHHAIALYEECLAGKLLAPGLRDWAVEFRGDHLGHRDTQVALIEERGGRAPRPLSSYHFRGLAEGEAALRELHEIERAAGDAYLAVIGNIRTDDYLLSAAYILNDEVRHLTTWARALGLRIY
jgi:hypothetical protein